MTNSPIKHTTPRGTINVPLVCCKQIPALNSFQRTHAI
nr:MAG TPA: hypothetical protein [Caudoviricetes sp.]